MAAPPLLLFELKNPREFKYGGELTEEESRRLVKRVELAPCWAPHPRKTVEVENICGVFSGCFEASEMNSQLERVCFKVCSPFGVQREISHIHGHVTVINAPGLKKSISFKGVKGLDRLDALRMDMLLPVNAVGRVHMGIFLSFIGKRLQTDLHCYLENQVVKRAPWLQIDSRFEQNNLVRLSVLDWSFVGLPVELRPIANDLVVTGKGSLLHRFKWANIPWTKDGERAIVQACQFVADAVEGLC